MSDVAILGVAAYHHGCAAVTLRGGKVVAAATEPAESADNFPSRAIRECLRQSGLAPADIDFVAFAGKPRAEFARALLQAPVSPAAFVHVLQPWLERRLHVVDAVEHTLGRRYQGCCLFVDNAGDALAAASGCWQHVLSYSRPDPAMPNVIQVERAEGGRGNNGRLLLLAAYPVVMVARTMGAVRRAATASPHDQRAAEADAVSYFSQATADSPMNTTAAVLARLSRWLISAHSGDAPSRARRRQDDAVPDEIYTLW